jgi:hypothetical protein
MNHNGKTSKLNASKTGVVDGSYDNSCFDSGLLVTINNLIDLSNNCSEAPGKFLESSPAQNAFLAQNVYENSLNPPAQYCNAANFEVQHCNALSFGAQHASLPNVGAQHAASAILQPVRVHLHVTGTQGIICLLL